jgi:hypothetical protein
MTWHSGMTTSVGGETIPERGKGGDDVDWVDMNFIGPKNKEISHGRFTCCKWTVKI